MLKDWTDEKLAVAKKDEPAKTELAIEFVNVSRRYKLHHENRSTLIDRTVNMFKPRQNSEIFWALKDLNFQLEKGKVLGVIGSNGAGKSTLLKLATRILEPTTGTIRVKGRVSAMLELGTGFHPDLTGRENIYLNGAFYGFDRKDMDERYERIVEFSELSKFIDTPIKHYSSGMSLRLGFAIAMTVDPEILIIDEVLAVGDAAFARKCHIAIDDMKRRGVTMLFVSHAAGEVSRLCDEVIYLKQGQMVARGKPGDVLDEYMISTMGPKYMVSTAQPAKLTAKSSLSSQIEPNSTFEAGNKAPGSNLFRKIATSGDTVEEQLLYTNSGRIANLEPYLKPSNGIIIEQANTNWLFTLPAVGNNYGSPAAENYLAVLNHQSFSVDFQLNIFKESTASLDKAAGVQRKISVEKDTVEPSRLKLIRLNNEGMLNASFVQVELSTPLFAELVQCYPVLPAIPNLPTNIQTAVPSKITLFPYCDIRGENQCRFKVLNPNNQEVEFIISGFYDSAEPFFTLRKYKCPANSVINIHLNEELAYSEAALQPGQRFYGSLLIKSSLPVISQRFSLQRNSPFAVYSSKTT